MPDYIILRFNFTLSIRTYGSGNAFFCKAFAFHFVRSTLYGREKYKLLCRFIGKKPIKNTLSKTCIYLEIYIRRTLVPSVMCLTSKMDNSINLRQINATQIIP